MKSHSSRITTQIQFPSGSLSMIEYSIFIIFQPTLQMGHGFDGFYLNWTSFPLKSPKDPILYVFLIPAHFSQLFRKNPFTPNLHSKSSFLQRKKQNIET